MKTSMHGDLRQPPSEQLRVSYRNKAHYGPVSGGGTVPRGSGIKAVVGKVGTISRGDMGCRSDGGGRNVLGGVFGIGGGGRYRELKQNGY